MKNKGIIPINKPIGWTSFDVVNKIKHKIKPLKVGHLGTLDPMATGVLLVTVGKATKLFDLMQEKTKTYIAKFQFGSLTDTLDATGLILETTNNIPTLSEIKQVLPKFIGKISQIPPKYSAKSINGKRAYDLARQNIEFELQPKDVDIYNIDIIAYENNVLTLEILCGSGTYIRSIGRDIARELNSLATMTDLVRTKVGNFKVENCIDITKCDQIHDKIIPIKEILNYEILQISEMDKKKVLNGQTITILLEDGLYAIEEDDDIIAIVKIEKNKAKMSIFLG